MAKKSKNLFAEDPTRTLTLRNRAVGEINRRYGRIKRLITETIVRNKVFLENARALTDSDFIFLRTPAKLERFDIWLESIIGEIILSGSANVTASDTNWLISYFEEAYMRGVKNANNRMATIVGRNQIPTVTVLSALPFHIDRAGLLFIRDFTQLKGITEVMSQQINFVLSEGLLKGENPRNIARAMNDRVDKIGISRSRLLARTEIINANNLGMINEGQRLQELVGEEVVYHWITAGDIKVREDHVTRNNKYYSYDRVIHLIGEPNCRCATPPIPISLVPDGIEVRR